MLESFAKVWHWEAVGPPLFRSPRRYGPPLPNWEASAVHKLLGDVAHSKDLRYLSKDREIRLIFQTWAPLLDWLCHPGSQSSSPQEGDTSSLGRGAPCDRTKKKPSLPSICSSRQRRGWEQSTEKQRCSSRIGAPPRLTVLNW